MIKRLMKIVFFVVLNLIAWASRWIWELNNARKRTAALVSLRIEKQVKKSKAA